jgi:hypothetical protein
MDQPTIYCPANVNFLLHCYTNPDPYPNIRAYQELIQQWIAEGVIAKEPSWTPERETYMTTALGTAWVRSICAVRRPTVAFIDQHGNLIADHYVV